MRLPRSAAAFLLTHPFPYSACLNCCLRTVSKSRSDHIDPATGFRMQRAFATKRRETVEWRALDVLIATGLNGVFDLELRNPHSRFM